MKNFSAFCCVLLLVIFSSYVHAQALFEEHIIQENFKQTMSVYATDVDHDGDMDVLGAAWQDNTIAWWENDGQQNFATHIITNNFTGVRTIWADDMDQDGDVDLLAAGNVIAWWENDGNQHFTQHDVATSFTGGHTIYSVDLDRDGDLDIIASAWSTKGIHWWENDGNQNYTEHIITQGGNQYPGVYFADLDNDADIDVIGCVWGNNRISWWENDGNENFTEHVLATNFAFAHWVHAADLDSDGDQDILGAAYGANEVAWWENDGTRNFVKNTISNSFGNVTSVFGKDLDGDGDVDVLSAAETASQIRWWENDGDQHFTEHIIANNFLGASHAHPEDLDGDGDIDVIGAARFGHKISWWESINVFLEPDFVARPMTGHAPLTVQFKDSSYARPAATAWQWDFNNDGTIDAQDQNPAFAYEQPGAYSIRIIVSNDSLSQTITRENCIKVFDGESALYFDGKAGVAKCPATPTLNLTLAATIEAWINPNGWGSLANMGFGRIVDKKNISLFLNGQGGSLHPHSLAVWLATVNGTAGYVCTPENSINLNQWQHVAVTYDGTSSVARIFINGVEQTVTQKSGQFAGAIVDNNAIDLRIGNGATPFVFDGIIDEARIWNIVRSPAEIQASMNAYLKGNESGLVGYFQMNEGNGFSFADCSSFKNSGRIENAAWTQGIHLPQQTGMQQAENMILPKEFQLLQNYPNPFNSRTTFQFNLPLAEQLTFYVYNLRGQLVKSLADGELWQAGAHSIEWDGTDKLGQLVSSGLYLYSLETKEFKQTRKMLYVK